jgi:hypothetical protein
MEEKVKVGDFCGWHWVLFIDDKVIRWGNVPGRNCDEDNVLCG